MSAAKLFLIALASVMVASCDAKDDVPVVKVYAYQREVHGGIPGGGPPGGPGAQPRIREKQYSIYLEVKSADGLHVDGVWMNGHYHQVETTTKKAPVIMSTPMVMEDSAKSVLVPATASPVVEIIVKSPIEGTKPDSGTIAMMKDNAAVVQLTFKGKSMTIAVKKFESKDAMYLQ